jgi:hypothetical protein
LTQKNKTSKEKRRAADTYIREDAISELVFFGFHALPDERVPHLDVLGVPWSVLERGERKVHIAALAKFDESPREFIRLQKCAFSVSSVSVG